MIWHQPEENYCKVSLNRKSKKPLGSKVRIFAAAAVDTAPSGEATEKPYGVGYVSTLETLCVCQVPEDTGVGNLVLCSVKKSHKALLVWWELGSWSQLGKNTK